MAYAAIWFELSLPASRCTGAAHLVSGTCFVLMLLAFAQHGFGKNDSATNVFDNSHSVTYLHATYSVCLHSLVMQFWQAEGNPRM